MELIDGTLAMVDKMAKKNVLAQASRLLSAVADMERWLASASGIL